MIKAKTSLTKTASKKVVAKKAAPKNAGPKPAAKEITPSKSESVKVISQGQDVKRVTTAPRLAKGTKVVSTDINGVGRRKSSVARVWLSRGTGTLEINGRTLETYFNTLANRSDAVKALELCGMQKAYQLKINVQGGGPCSQAGAVRLGIARALVKHNEAFKEVLRKGGLLTVDARVKERKKPGQAGARRKFQFVKR
ncbi:MAG: 30S ribosomal protein S9 [Proteobacteria bacterium]|jgi:small subunit ribosomal protein S9|nr:30S ribosomal protein S9 [Pseudomonadota bacterium]NBP14361.1 30S ribosomal protein S9 [bacterium]